ncbi:MAG: LysM peptidoglycan-binding domain-containing protein, partial [Bacteroidota bacterium]
MKKVFKEKKIKLLALILFLFSFSTFSQSNFEIKTIDEKKYIVHIAEKGQTLYAISKKYFVDSKFITEANPKAKEGISEGQEVLIPYDIYLLNQEQFNADTTGFIVHKVLKSETQYGLIKKYSVTESDLKTLNPFIKLGLKEGQLLRIKKRAPLLDLVQNSSDFNPKDDSSFVWYTAIEKDSLVHIARKFKTTVSRIQRLNSWSYLEFMKSKVLKPGQKIKIFPKNFSEEASNLYKQNEEKI